MPNHYLFSAFGEHFKNVINLKLGDKRIDKYLKGEEIDVNLPEGFGSVLIENCALGGFKMSNNKFKNHYPKGLRNYK